MDHAETDRSGHDDQVHVVLVLNLGQGPNTAGRHRAEKHDAGTAQDGRRNRCDHSAQDRQEAKDHQDEAAGADNEAALDACDGHEPNVLGEGALREGVEQR